MRKFILIFSMSFFINSVNACEETFSESTIGFLSWLGKDSKMSTNYIKGRCAIDNALNSVSGPQRRVIINMVAKSYEYDKYKNIDSNDSAEFMKWIGKYIEDFCTINTKGTISCL